MTRTQRALVLTTLGADGYPHHAFLGEDEVAGSDAARRTLSVPARSRTAANLERRRVATLLWVESGGVRVLKLRRAARSAAGRSGRRSFALDVVADGIAPLAPGEKARVSGLAYRRGVEA